VGSLKEIALSLTSCLKKAGTALNAEDRAAIIAAAGEYRRGGMEGGAAAMKAVADRIELVQGMLRDAESKAQNGAQENGNDTRGDGPNNADPLGQQLPSGNAGSAEGLASEAGAGMRPADADGNGRAGGGRAAGSRGVGRGKKSVLPGTAAEVRPVSRSPVASDPGAQNQLSGDAPGNYEITAEDGIGEGTEGQKLRANMEAIRTLRRIQADNRNATVEEQAVMAKFIGWGGLRKLIDPNTTGRQWLDARAELLGTNGQQPLLIDGDKGSEWIALQRSTTAAHFTAPPIVSAMWSVVRHFGFIGGRVLEPTSGIGNFIGLQPRDLAAASEWHGAELDSITGQMAKLIYPEAAISAGIGFENVPFAKGAFALAIGNPPFGSLTLTSDVAAYKGIPSMKIHNFIISKTGEHLRPGGVMAMVVTHRFLDTANPEAREHLGKNFKFLGAFRLPNDAFLKNAGTEVTTDVIFLQKLHVGEKATDFSWLDTEGSITVDGQAMRVNRYYEQNPANILGRSAMDGTMYAGRQGKGGEYTVHSDGRDLTQAIEAMLTNQWADLKGVAKPTNSDVSASAAMMQQSDLAVGGVMLAANDKLMRREMDDADGNAVVVEVTPQSLWRDDAEKWKRALDVLTAIKDKKPLEAQEIKPAIALAYTAKGEKKPKPTKAEQAIYDIADALDRPGFEWRFDVQLDKIQGTVQGRMLGSDGYSRLKGLIGLRNTALQLIEAERRDSTADMKELRARLNAEYDAFIDSYGLVNDSANSGLLQGDVGVESGLETSYRAKNGKVKSSAAKSDIFARRVNFPYREITSAKDAADGLQVSLSERGKLDIQYIAKLTGQSAREVIADLSSGDAPAIFMDPDTNEYADADQYLSGNVKLKLDKATAAGLRENMRALKAVQPAPKTKDNVRPSIRGAWMPESVFQDFLTDLGAQSPKVSIIASQGMILASSNSVRETEFGTQFKNSQKSVVELFNAAASGKPITIWTKDSKGNRVKNDTATKEVNLLVERMAKVFDEWAWSSDPRVQQVVDAFNEKMNTHVARQYDGNKYLRPVGASPSIELRTTQKNAAWRMVQAETVLLDHVVGAGKTYTVITGAMQRRRLGLSRKPMIVVPNHLVTQWARDFYNLYPGAKILAATPDDFAKNKRRRLFSRIATGDFDAIIIGHSSLSFIETPVADQQLVINEQIKELQDALNELKAKKESGRTLTQIQEKLQKYEGKLKELQDVRRDDIGIDLEKMGVDYLAVDEMHEFKNLEYSTTGERVVGMNDPKGSKKAFDLYLKIRGLLSRGGGVTGATGTPVSNSLVELYTMLKYLAHKDLVSRNQMNFDAWSGAYARTETRLEYTATQKLKARRVLAGLNNLSALKQLYEQFADIISMADLKRIYAEDVRRKNAKDGTNLREGFPVPKVKGGQRKLEAGPITEPQSVYMDYLVARMQAIEANKRNKEYAKIDNPLWVLSDARKMSLDIRIVDPTAPRDENGKVMRAAANIVSTYKKWDAELGAQMVFCDLSTPSKHAVKEARSLIRESVEKLFGGGAEGKRMLARVTALESFVDQWRLLEELANEVMEHPGTDQELVEKMEEYLSSLEDVDATMVTADIGFSVYDDMRTVLIEKGIPEAEIAFIHDYNTPEQKAKLFADVNDGTIRVLMGSSAKMGAGTNAQRRLVAMHHMDAPWRPSDVEQREGRIIRQGNMLFEKDPDGFEVDIRSYSTSGTSDAVMWQVLERKARAIEEFRNAGLDHTDEEGSDSNQYAEFMAQSTGNPVFRLKLEAERSVDLLDTDSRGALLARSQAQRFLSTYKQDVAAAQAMVDYAENADVSSVEVRGQKGTAAELDVVVAAARQKYEAAYAEFLARKEVADAELKAWTELPEDARGDKPKMPTVPSMPGLLSKGILDGSGYARAIKAALENASESGYKFNFGTMQMRARKSMYSEDLWILDAWNGSEFSTYATGSGKAAESSSTLANALAPDALRALARQYEYGGKSKLDYLNGQHDIKVRLAEKSIDTRPLEQAKEAMYWLQSQVAFAEQQADIRRGERPNRYIVGDKKRSLSQAKVEAGEELPVEFEGEVFNLTGFRDGFHMQAVGDDGREVLLNMPVKDGKREVARVVEKPRNVAFSGLLPKDRRAATSTNLAQTGASAANETDVVFSRGRGAGVPMDDAQALAAAIREAFPAAPPIFVHESVDKAPAALRAAIKKAGAMGDVEAAFHEGEIHVFPQNLASLERMAFVVGHHELRHYGLRSMLGPRLGPTMLALWNSNPALQAAAKQVMADGHAKTRVLAVEEALADMPVEALTALKGWDKIVAAVRQWLRQVAARLRKMEFPALADVFEPDRWTDNDVAALVSRAEDVSKGGMAVNRATGTAFQRAWQESRRGAPKDYREGMSDSRGSRFPVADYVPAAADERLSNDKVVAAKKLSELLVSDAEVVQPFGSLDVVSQGRVLSVVRSLLQDLKVLGAVVRLIPVDVVNVLGGKKLSPQSMLDNPAMLVDLLPTNAKNLVAGDIPAMNVLAQAVALAAAKVHTGLARFDVGAGDFLTATGALHDGVSKAISSSVPQPYVFEENANGAQMANPIRRAPRVTQDTQDGAPVFASDDITIAFPQVAERFEVIPSQDERVVNYAIMPAQGFDVLGHVELLIRDGRPVSLLDIEITPAGRRQGAGRKTIETLLSANPDSDLNISNIVQDARGFWERMGVPQQNLEQGAAYDGNLNWNTYAQAQDGIAAFDTAPQGRAARQGRNTGAESAGRGDADEAQEGLTRFSRAPTTTANARGQLADALTSVREAKLPAGYILNDFIAKHGELSVWDKTVGTMHNLAERNPLFKPVYDAANDFLNDVSSYATEAADLAPTVLPKLEGLRDIGKTPLSAKDTEVISKAIFQGTLSWTRDEDGQPIEEADPQKAGIVWRDAELTERFGMNAKQIGLYREFRAATDKSLTDMAITDMIRFIGKDAQPVAQQALAAKTVGRAATILQEHLADMAADAGASKAASLAETGATIGKKAAQAARMIARGYAPLMRFGQHTLDVTENGQRVYFGLFESRSEANRFARNMQKSMPKAAFAQGTMSQEAYKLFAGVSPETVELFGNMLGLESQGNEASSRAFQEYLKLVKDNRSTMKRLIERKGIAGYSEDAGRVLAGFVYSNARQAAKNLHFGAISEAVQKIQETKGEGQLMDAAVSLQQYITNPVEEAQKVKGLLFAQFLGGSLAAGMVNLSQSVMVTFPYLSQFGGVAKSAAQMKAAVSDALKWETSAEGKATTGDKVLDAAIKKAEEEGVISPQEVHALIAQAGGSGALRAGDGTKAGDLAAKGSNFMSKLMLAWGRPFSVAEQFNRRVTFIAAYRTAVAQGMADPAAFAEKAVVDTQFNYTKANRPQWARGAIGSVLFTFKTYSISYVELMVRMAKSGPEGRKAALLGMGMLFLMAGTQGLPGADDLDDLIDGALQRMGYNFSSKAKKQALFASVFGDGGARFMMSGLSGLPGAPIDVAGRLGLGNLIPGTGLLTKKDDHSYDVAEIFGPAGSLAKQYLTGADLAIQGEIGAGIKAALPVAAANVAKAADMAATGQYRDTRGRKVLETDLGDAAAKAIGFQPNDVARVQKATFEIQQRVALAKMREAEIAEKWARGIVDQDAALRDEARAELARWNDNNPESRITITTPQLLTRMRAMREDKIARLTRTTPAEMRNEVRRELEAAR
jgi:N12 class adenine-specific DNA methylase